MFKIVSNIKYQNYNVFLYFKLYTQVSIVLMAALMVSASPKPEAKPEAKPGLLAAPLAYSAPLVAAPVVTATSSQAFVRQYNGLAAAPLVAAGAPLAYTAGAPLAYTAAAYTSPYAPYVSYASPYAYSAYAAPLRYTAAAAPVLL